MTFNLAYTVPLACALVLVACGPANPAPAGSECPDVEVATAGWQRVDAGPFTLRVPPGFEPVDVQPIDSRAGALRNDSTGAEIAWDYGWYSNDLAPDTGVIAERLRCHDRVGDRPVTIVVGDLVADRQAGTRHVVAGAWRDVDADGQPVHLTVWSTTPDSAHIAALRGVIASIEFEDGDAQSASGDPVRAPAAVEPAGTFLTPEGWGVLRIGMSRAEVVAAAGEDANPEAVGGPDPERCDEFHPRNTPAGLRVMIQAGVLTRISVSRNVDVETAEGLSVGDPEADVLAAYGDRANVQPHQYQEPPAKYITVWQGPSSDPRRRGLRYEIDVTGRVVHVHAGTSSIENVEGCV